MLQVTSAWWGGRSRRFVPVESPCSGSCAVTIWDRHDIEDRRKDAEELLEVDGRSTWLVEDVRKCRKERELGSQIDAIIINSPVSAPESGRESLVHERAVGVGFGTILWVDPRRY